MNTQTLTDWLPWVDRFDRMQNRYTLARQERFEMITQLIGTIAGSPKRVLDLGCGTGSLSAVILKAFPACEVVGIDTDATMLALAEPRLAQLFPGRTTILHGDLRQEGWTKMAGGGFDAAVSSTALHWLSEANLARLYHRLASVLRGGGVFLNADHVASRHKPLQQHWEQAKRRELAGEDHSQADTWPEFWQAYAAALDADVKTMGGGSVGRWEGVEQGMPLAWHFHRLHEAGFACVECFWRCHGDAIYGGIRSESRHE